MAFWSDSTLEPKRQFKFKVTFGWLNTTAGNESTFLAQSADRPVYTISDSQKVHYLDKEFTFPGKITWTPVKMTFVDAYDATAGVVTNVGKSSYAYLGNAGWISPKEAGPGVSAKEMKTIGKSDAVRTAKGSNNITIEVLKSNGQVVDSWVLHNAFVTTVALNELNYAQEGILTAQYTFRYDWAELTS